MASRPPSPLCRRIESLTRRARERLLHWIAAGAVIEEVDGAALEDRELTALSEAIDQARRAGR